MATDRSVSRFLTLDNTLNKKGRQMPALFVSVGCTE
jgi:hypothetical protein